MLALRPYWTISSIFAIFFETIKIILTPKFCTVHNGMGCKLCGSLVYSLGIFDLLYFTNDWMVYSRGTFWMLFAGIFKCSLLVYLNVLSWYIWMFSPGIFECSLLVYLNVLSWYIWMFSPCIFWMFYSGIFKCSLLVYLNVLSWYIWMFSPGIFECSFLVYLNVLSLYILNVLSWYIYIFHITGLSWLNR